VFIVMRVDDKEGIVLDIWHWRWYRNRHV